MDSLTEQKKKALMDLIDFCTIPRLRKLFISKFLTDIIDNPSSYSKEEMQDVKLMYLFLENISEA